VTDFLDHPGPIAFAHRGFSRDGLENSMTAFAAAVDLGYRYLETDVHATRDGALVAFHDRRLARVTGSRGRMARLTWDVVDAVRIGGRERVPLLEDVLGTWPQVRVNVDVKHPAAIEPLVGVLERTAAHGRVCIASFSDRRRTAVLRRLPHPVTTSAGAPTVARFLAAVGSGQRTDAVRRALAGVDCLQVPERITVPLAGGRRRVLPIVTPRTLQAAHAAGVAVHVWVVNEPADMHRLLDLGVDGLMTDRADTLRDVLRERGQWAT
jgi:glycerophosphoryl diester phosphodiesterase